MSAGTKIIGALLAVTALGWGLVATSPGPEKLTLPLQPKPPESDSTSQSLPVALTRQLPASQPRPAAPPSALAASFPEDPDRAVGDTHAVEVDGPAEAAESEREGQTEISAIRYDAVRDRFDGESRDETWAAEQERILSNLAGETGPGEPVEAIECRSSMCQLRLHFDAVIAAKNVERLAPLTEIFSEAGVMRRVGLPGQRMMVVYVPREGRWLDPPVEEPAFVMP